MKPFVTVILTLAVSISNGQGSKGLILTREENAKWLRTIEKLESKEQFEFLKSRLLADTNVYLSDTDPDKGLEKRAYEG